MTHVHCPVCEFRLRGKPREGYRCVRCHARYSARFVRQLRQRQFRQLINHHFGQRAEEFQSTLVVEDTDGAIEAAVTAPEESPTEDIYLDLDQLVSTHEGTVPHTTDEPRIVTPFATLHEYEVDDAPGTRKARNASPVRRQGVLPKPAKRVASKSIAARKSVPLKKASPMPVHPRDPPKKRVPMKPPRSAKGPIRRRR